MLSGCGQSVTFPTPSGGPSAQLSGPSAGSSPGPASDRVTAFYYFWYGTPQQDGQWRHRNQNGHKPPDDIASIYYPERGPYSSRDPAILAEQMAELSKARIAVIAVSWWGQGGWEDQALSDLFAAASTAGIKIAFHIEPYTGRTAQSVVADIRYLLTAWGSSPALYRVSRPTSASASSAARPVFYIFAASQLVSSDLRAGLAGLRGTADDSIVLVHSPSPATATRDGADGIYTYNPLASPDTFAALVSGCKAANLLCSPDVSPGFDNSQAVASGARLMPRQNGARYDAMWQAAIAAGAEWIGVVSFDEWHEGTQIEPAKDFSSGARTYAGYDGAYGTSKANAPEAYLDRTAYWVGQLGKAAG